MSKDSFYACGLGIITVIAVVLQMMYPQIPLYIGWPIVGILAIFSVILFVKGHGVAITENKSVNTVSAITTSRIPEKTKLGKKRRVELYRIKNRMRELHGHSDDFAIEIDYRDGIPLGDLLTRNCTVCGKPRNQWVED